MFNVLCNSVFVAFLVWNFSQIKGDNELKFALFEFKIDKQRVNKPIL